MTIDQDTGNIALDDIGTTIGPSLARSQFLQTQAFAASKIVVQNEPWFSYRLPAIPQADTELTLILQFHGERLASVSLSHDAPHFGSSWADWSEERELARKLFHERWLATELGVDLGRYSWGSISSNYDVKGGSSSIRVTFNDPSE